MRAMVLEQPGSPLQLRELAQPQASKGEILIHVAACGVCRTDLHIIDGELAEPKLPLILGHQIIGRIAAIGAEVSHFTLGQRVGVPWLGEPVIPAPIAWKERKIFAHRPSTPVIKKMADLPTIVWLMLTTASQCLNIIPIQKPLHCYVQDLSATAVCALRKAQNGSAFMASVQRRICSRK